MASLDTLNCCAGCVNKIFLSKDSHGFLVAFPPASSNVPVNVARLENSPLNRISRNPIIHSIIIRANTFMGRILLPVEKLKIVTNVVNCLPDESCQLSITIGHPCFCISAKFSYQLLTVRTNKQMYVKAIIVVYLANTRTRTCVLASGVWKCCIQVHKRYFPK